MEKLLSPHKNFQGYRKALNASAEPCIPLLRTCFDLAATRTNPDTLEDVHLRDLKGHHSSHATIIRRDGHPDRVNFKLYRDLHEQICQMLNYNDRPLKSPDNPLSREVRMFIDSQIHSLIVNDPLRRRLEQRAVKLEREEHMDFASHTLELKATGFLPST